MTDIRVGIDIGGTFTDIVFLTSDGTVWTHKTLSTPDDYSRAIRDGVQSLLPQTGRQAGDIQDVLHGTTVATNAILEGTGARTGLLTTKGFRDVLEIRRMRSNRLYDISWHKPEPLVPRAWRREITERIDFQGETLIPLDAEEARREVQRLVHAGLSPSPCVSYTPMPILNTSRWYLPGSATQTDPNVARVCPYPHGRARSHRLLPQ
jgi:N-methylhydantoinase A